MCNRVMKPICWIMVLLLLVQWSGVSAIPEAQHDAAAKQEEIDRAVEKLERLFDALEDIAKEIPRDTFDPQAIVDTVGPAPLALFEWVRNNTYFVPYRGTLRGPIGVLMDRRGNSLDRALLLTELLVCAGHDARLVRQNLEDNRLGGLLSGNRSVSREAVRRPLNVEPRNSNALVTGLARKLRVSPEEVSAKLNTTGIHYQRLTEELTQRVHEQTAKLGAILSPLGEQRGINTWETVEATLRDHWWVQWRDGTNWISLDPTLGSTYPGDKRPTGAQHLSIDEIDRHLEHRVTLKVIAERWERGKLVEETALTRSFSMPRYSQDPIHVRYIPVSNASIENEWSASLGSPTDLKRLVRKQDQWLPVLGIGDDLFWQYSITASGRLKGIRHGFPDSVEELGTHGKESVRDVVSALSGVGESETEKTGSHLTAVYVQYETQVPDSNTRIDRRYAFDLLEGRDRLYSKGPTKFDVTDEMRMSRALSLAGDTDVYLQRAQLSHPYVQHFLLHSLLGIKEDLLEVLRQGELEGDALARVELAVRRMSPALSLAVARSAWMHISGEVFLGLPNIITYYRGLCANSEGVIKRCHSVDIVNSDVCVIPDASTSPFLVRLQQGVFDTNAESLLMRSQDAMPKNASEIFAVSLASGIPWSKVVNREEAARLVPEPHHHEFSILFRYLDKGYLLVMPERSVPFKGEEEFAWWAVHNQTGATLGFVEQRGEAQTEYEVLTTQIVDKFLVKSLGSFTVCMMSALPKDSGEGKSMSVAACVAGAVWSVVAVAASALAVDLYIMGAIAVWPSYTFPTINAFLQQVL